MFLTLPSWSTPFESFLPTFHIPNSLGDMECRISILPFPLSLFGSTNPLTKGCASQLTLRKPLPPFWTGYAFGAVLLLVGTTAVSQIATHCGTFQSHLSALHLRSIPPSR
uniref:Uncharacterized protein n=1 Tax=Marophrys sp. SRT127 TaxID=2488311 RepID=A0A455REV6_9EUKA|nr:hypothetical protein [Marophrys sp. SRT127]